MAQCVGPFTRVVAPAEFQAPSFCQPPDKHLRLCLSLWRTPSSSNRATVRWGDSTGQKPQGQGTPP